MTLIQWLWKLATGRGSAAAATASLLLLLVGCAEIDKTITGLQDLNAKLDASQQRLDQLDAHAKADRESVERAEAEREAQDLDLQEAEKASTEAARLSLESATIVANDETGEQGQRAIETGVAAHTAAKVAAEYEASARKRNAAIGEHLSSIRARQPVSESIRAETRRDAQAGARISQGLLAQWQQWQSQLAFGQMIAGAIGFQWPGASPRAPRAAAPPPVAQPPAQPPPQVIVPQPGVVEQVTAGVTRGAVTAATGDTGSAVGAVGGALGTTAALVLTLLGLRRRSQANREARESKLKAEATAEAKAAALHAVNGHSKTEAKASA